MYMIAKIPWFTVRCFIIHTKNIKQYLINLPQSLSILIIVHRLFFNYSVTGRFHLNCLLYFTGMCLKTVHGKTFHTETILCPFVQLYITLFHAKPSGLLHYPYPEPVYTGWSSVHWNATGMLPVDPVYTGNTTWPPSEYLQSTLEHHWKNLVETAQHWNATGKT